MPLTSGNAIESRGGLFFGGGQNVSLRSVTEDAGNFSAEERRREQEQGDQQNDQKSDTARTAAIARQAGLDEHPKEVIAQVKDHGGYGGSGDVSHDREKQAREKIYG